MRARRGMPAAGGVGRSIVLFPSVGFPPGDGARPRLPLNRVCARRPRPKAANRVPCCAGGLVSPPDTRRSPSVSAIFVIMFVLHAGVGRDGPAWAAIGRRLAAGARLLSRGSRADHAPRRRGRAIARLRARERRNSWRSRLGRRVAVRRGGRSGRRLRTATIALIPSSPAALGLETSVVEVMRRMWCRAAEPQAMPHLVIAVRAAGRPGRVLKVRALGLKTVLQPALDGR